MGWLRRKAALEDSPAYREMYDAADPTGIPRTAKMVACYLDGEYDWAGRAHRLFPDATVVTIAVNAADDADVLDVEPGCASIWQVRGWAKRQIRRGIYRPTVYCSRWRKHAIAVLTMRVRKDWWVADWTGHAHTVPGAAVVQYASNRRFDVSLVRDPGWPYRTRPHRRPQPPVTNPPKPPRPQPAGPTRLWDETMLRIHANKHAETAVPLPTGAKGIRITAAPTAVLLVDWGNGAKRYTVAFDSGPTDIPAERVGKSLARQAKIVRAEGDIGADASVCAI
jgi:hypothetical protein